MKVSFNQIRKYTSISLSDNELVQKIGAQLGAVEEVIEFGKKFDGALIAKVISCQKHPNADRLSVCLIDDNGKAQNVQRDQNGKVIVVCGAPNVREGLTVAWLPPGSTVPSTYDNDPFVLEARELRGVVSNGMLASPKELALSDDHAGILEIDEELQPGTEFSEAFNLKNDVVIDIENKMFTHRPDLFGQLGVAREIAGIQNIKFEDPDWYWKIPKFESGEGLKLEVANEAPQQVRRFMAVALKGVEIKPSPLWLQIALTQMGGKPINNIVDATNYIMLLTAQPTHAYDYDKLRGHKLASRLAKNGESLKLLNGKTYSLNESDIVITDGEGAVGLAGIMGGGDSEISADTKNIVLEVANFDMYSVRRSSMRHGVFSDALTRFNKGQSLLQNDRVMSKLIDLIKEVSSASQASGVFDIYQEDESYDSQSLSGSLDVYTEFINKRLGSKLSDNEIAELLRNVHFACIMESEGILSVTAPFWRTDISIAEDIVEEVGRLSGYNKLPLQLPIRGTAVSKPDKIFEFKVDLRRKLASFGANEVMNYSFVPAGLIKNSGQKSDMAFEISNALSPDLQYYRMSLIPGLLGNINPNIRDGYDNFVLFELGKLHNKLHKENSEGVPKEFENLALVCTGKKVKPGEAYYTARNYIDQLARSLRTEIVYMPIEKEADLPVVKPFEIKRSALVVDGRNGSALGIVGEFKSDVASWFKLPAGSAGFELGIYELLKSSSTETYTKLSRYPSISQDLCLQVGDTVTYHQLKEELQRQIEKNTRPDQIFTVKPIDIYSSDDLSEQKRITFRIKLTSYSQTLTEDTLSLILNKASEELAQVFKAQRI